ncbi:MAG: hypothetical protein ACREEL_10455 [Stellaceae bacterium]
MSKILGPLALAAAFAFISPALAAPSSNGSAQAMATSTSNVMSTTPQLRTTVRHAASWATGQQMAQAFNLPA